MNWCERILDRAETEWQGPPPRAKTYEISMIYPGSVAEAAGLKPKMLYAPRDGGSAPFCELKERDATGVSDWSFIDEKREAVIRLRTRGFPFGMKMRRTVEGLCADIAMGNEYSDEIFERIHDDDDDVFARLVQALESPARGSFCSLSPLHNWSPPLHPHWLSNWTTAFERPIWRRSKPNQMAAGVYHALNGRTDLARQLMQPYEEDPTAASLATSLYAFGQSVIAEAEGASGEEVDNWLEQAAERHPKSRRIRNRMARRGCAPRPGLDSDRPRPFPLNYCLLERDPLGDADRLRQPFVGLRETLSGLAADEFLIVIMLGRYRANAYYVTLLDQLLQIHRLIGGHFPAAHVVTSHQEGAAPSENLAENLAREQRARESGLSYKVLHDPEDFVATMLDIPGSPTAAIVNRRGQIVYQGHLTDDEGYWTALASLKQHGPEQTGPYQTAPFLAKEMQSEVQSETPNGTQIGTHRAAPPDDRGGKHEALAEGVR